MRNESIQLVRDVLRRASGSPAANNQVLDLSEIDSAKQRVGSSFGFGLLCLAVISMVASFSKYLDPVGSLMFFCFGLVLAAIGAFYIDRANITDQALLRKK